MRPVILCLVFLVGTLSVPGQAPPTLRIVTEDPNLPAQLYYGDIKVKPLRLRPGTNTVITIDDPDFFVFQQYVDFLKRMPDSAGFEGWLAVLNNCAVGDTTCDRVHVSRGFFQSPEFQERGYFAYRMYSVGFGRKPNHSEFVPDLRSVSGFLTDAQKEAAKAALVDSFVNRPAFASKYPATMDNATFVDSLLATAGVTLPNRQDLINALNNGSKTRGRVLREIMESSQVYQKYYNQAFVVMQYFGYLGRDPDALYVNWIQVLDETGDPRHMIAGFVNSTEYRNRF